MSNVGINQSVYRHQDVPGVRLLATASKPIVAPGFYFALFICFVFDVLVALGCVAGYELFKVMPR